MRPLTIIALTLIFGLLGVSKLTFADNSKIAFPENYRSWTHVKSMVILPGHSLADPFQGIHHIYANDKALEGYKTGKFPDGAMIVFDLLEYEEGGNAMQEGSRKLIGIMDKSSTKYADTNGWGYEGFGGDSKTKRLVKDSNANCHSCHAAASKTDYVYSKYRK